MLIIHPVGGGSEPLTGVYDCTRKRTTDGEYSLSFSIIRTKSNATQFDALQSKAKVECEGELFVVDDVQREPLGDSFTKSITANHEMFDRLQANGITSSYTAQKPIADWLDIVLAGTGLDYEVIGDFDSQQFDNFGMTDSLSMFKDIIEQFGCEYRVIGTHLVIAKLIGNVTDAQFRHGHNLKTFSDEYDTSDGALVTEVKAFGKNDDNGNPTVSVDVKSSNFGKFDRPYIKIVQDERFTNEDSLRTYAESLLSDGKYSAKVEQQELYRNGLKIHDYDIGDYVYCIYELDSGVGIDLQPRIVSIEDYPEDPTKSPVLELGNFSADITRTIMSLNKTASKQAKISADTKRANDEIDKLSAEAVRIGSDTEAQSAKLSTMAVEADTTPVLPVLKPDGSIFYPETDASAIKNLPVSPVTSVAGKTGAVSLDKSDVGLDQVDNTSDVDKPVSTLQAEEIAKKQDKILVSANGNKFTLSVADDGTVSTIPYDEGGTA